MTLRHFLLTCALAAVLPAAADDTRTEVVKFAKGQSATVISGKITGEESVIYKLHVSVTEKAPADDEEKPATGAVPQKVIDDCLAALRKQVGGKEMKVLSSKRGENSFIIDVEVTGAEKPWRCYHDGSKCTGTEYQGQG